jgi:hypothetical protein
MVRRTTSHVGGRTRDGSHGGCRAACQVLWNEQWLRRIGARDPTPANQSPSMRDLEARVLPVAFVPGAPTAAGRYMCQITELRHLSTPVRTHDWRLDVRPLLNGNVPAAGWVMAMLTRLFNAVQQWRHGTTYPVTTQQLPQGPTPVVRLDLLPGEMVRVRSKPEICRTLYQNENRGMWFGRETLRFCNQPFVVRNRVERIINERTGEMMTLGTPCVTLESACASGEFLRFNPQNEYVFWREIWLKRIDGNS